MAGDKDAIEKEILFGFLPVLKGERVYGNWDFIALQFCFGIAAWAFLAGSFTGLVVLPDVGVPAIILGESIPIGIMSFYAILFSRYGVDQFLLPRSTYGHRGNDLILLMWIPINWGWIAYSALFFGEAMIKILVAIQAPVPVWLTTEMVGVPVWALVAFWLGIIPAYLGPQAVKWETRIGAPFLTIVVVGLIYAVLAVYGIDHIMAQKPAWAEFYTPEMNRALAIEWNAGHGFAWAFYYGQWTRLAKSESAAYHGTYWGWGPVTCVAIIFAFFTILVTGDVDPTAWMIAIGGPVWGLLGLIFMAVSNMTALTLSVYTQCIPIKYTWPKLRWSWVVMTAAPAIILFQTGVFYSFNIFLTLIGIIWTINASLLLADFFVVRKGKFDLVQLYRRGPKYTYFHGWNISALIMYPVGYAFYFAIFDPISSVEGPIKGIFPYTTALIPTFVIIFVLYSIIGKALYGKQP